jgi:hypothetical protein
MAQSRRARARRIARLVRAQLTFERAFGNALAKAMRRHARAAATAFRRSGEPAALTALAMGQEEVAAIIERNMLRTMRGFAGILRDDLKTFRPTMEFKASPTFERYAREFVRRHALRRANSINRSSEQRLRRILRDAIEDGTGTAETARLIDTVIGSPVRARTIAMTETHTAASAAMDKQAEETGLPLTREWGASDDRRTRPTHASADGQQRKMGEAFLVGGAQMQFPGDPSAPASEVINCRCVLLYDPGDGT